MDDKQLIDEFNNEVGQLRWMEAESVYLAALHAEFERRGWDLSAIADGESLSRKHKVKLMGRKLVLLPDACG
jgi:hypothetical protein